MALAEWRPIDLTTDPDEARYEGDPGELLDVAEFVATRLRRPRWHSLAACRGQMAAGPISWYPARGESAAPAKAVCSSCPVAEECLADAMAHGTLGLDDGVWGGTSVVQRKAMRRAVMSPDGDSRPRCVDCGAPCTRTRCLACHNARALAQVPPSAA